MSESTTTATADAAVDARARVTSAQPTGRPLALVVGELITDAQTLARKEVELAKAEVASEVKKLVQGIVFVLIAAFVGIFILAFSGVTLAKALDNFMGEGWAWLLTTVIFALIAGLLGFLAYKRISNASLAPTKAQASVRETSEWVRSQLSRS